MVPGNLIGQMLLPKPKDFWKTDYNDSQWQSLNIPTVWELNGYGTPIYVNQRYEFDYLMKPNPPHVPQNYNPVGSYRREIVVDKTGMVKIFIFSSELYVPVCIYG